MELNQIRAFVAVAEELHFGRAAERLGMAQPPLSRTIRALETELDASLFHRTTRTVALSPAGSALFEPAKHMLATQRAALESVHRSSTGRMGQVRFGYSHPSSRDLAAALVAASQRHSPGISFHLESRVYADEGLERIMDGSLDLALVRWRERPPLIAGRPVQIERPCVAVPRDHRLAGRTSVNVDELRDERFVFLPSRPNSNLRETSMRLCLDAGFSPKVVQEAPDSQSIAALVAAGMGVAITFDSVAAGYGSDVTAVPVNAPTESTKLYLAYRLDHQDAALETVLDIAEAVLPTVR
ncbi:LysR family transcriptional regulator [Brevibacterium marinum]|uniref:DNA-binding transcriptional LysR family regulator n=1 Tax=Brevibacterium marinum TaxID=418643 RepID=A0A846S2W3_9MICO|nr:LysR substrate-binding domain-containing protein [Brevibacterium marinum]NJC55197.1 DNA-binding transcriptional LysR family regulator [Brevibacterium marinum]